MTRQVFQALISNGYEVRVDRQQRSEGTRVWLISRIHEEEVFYFFTDETEAQVVNTMACQYCTSTQLDEIFEEATFSLNPRAVAEPQYKFA